MRKVSLSRILAVLSLLAWAAAPGTAADSESKAADWMQFRGPRGLGVSGVQGAPTAWGADKNIAWKTEALGPGSSSPIVVGDRIYATGFSGYAVPGSSSRGATTDLKRHVISLKRANGDVLWRKEIPAAQPEQDKVREHGYASSTPICDSKRLYVFFGKSGVFAFTLDGEQKWHADVGSNVHGWGSATSPVIYKDLLIVNASVESESLVALNRETGKEVWRAGGIKESWNTPIFVPAGKERTELVLAIMGKVLGFDPGTGKQLWSCATGIGWYMVPSLVNDADAVYCIGGRTGGSLAVRIGGQGDVTGNDRLWTAVKGSNVPSPILHEGHLYWAHENLGIVYCVEAKTGNIVYEERLPGGGQIYASPVLADGKIYYFTREGVGFVIAAKPRFEQIARNELGGRASFDASPVVDGKRLLVRSDRYLYCIGVD